MDKDLYSQTFFIDLTDNFPKPSKVRALMSLEAVKDPAELAMVDAILTDLVGSYTNSQPCHIADPDSSCLKLYKFADYDKASPKTVMTSLHDKHLLLTGLPHLHREFDAKTLSLVGRLKREIIVHIIDHLELHLASGSTQLDTETHNTLGNDPPVDVSHRERLMQLEQLLDVVSCLKPKAINALDNPQAVDTFSPQKFNSGELTWSQGVGQEYYRRNSNTPYMDLQWALASTGRTTHQYHMDANGFATFACMDTSAKLWILATLKKGAEAEAFASIDLFTGHYSPDGLNAELWDFEVILLLPSMMLIMQPDTPHFVITITPCIARGAHFYCTFTIHDSIFGFYHTLIAKAVTNADHPQASRELLCRLLTLYNSYLTDSSEQRDTPILVHIPDLSTFNGFIDLIVLCNWFEFLNVLSPWGYSAKLGTVTERYLAIRLCAVAWRLLNWVFNNYDFEFEGLDSVVHDDIILTQTISGFEAAATIHHPFLAHQAHALINYKNTACQSDLGNV
ncbi:hypothetical protein DXG01_001440 [Tephrocybe rancida]|nr:hypothetical protein DXG01_001440 [Tephrocybe rancida]